MARTRKPIPDLTAEAPVISEKTAVLSLRRPWGRALVGPRPERDKEARGGGAKTIENRNSWPPWFGWYLVLSSANSPTKADVQKLKNTLLACDGNLDRYWGFGESQSVLGWILVSDAYEGSRGDPWENEGAIHWVVSDSVAFRDPIPGIVGAQSLYRFVSSMPGEQRSRVLGVRA